ncbi:hypothetical protein [Carboxydothermus hydrogenoformans]|uniref:Uncharacterized protein n=1 Tax=Carboxydothermus hydrogenoformans (strain ATCC BAA-161 / DSM 6008 / Z-2901) TaxID=246194 RepID=Q3A8U3_CARHZ|nr:hypothetical protein [Carboxydothermus hydrogenoformans]ABB14862.1 hypothetical protein CHY_2649 [Carboxydothermus hydrogenoformans Z-2901]
MGKIQPFQHRLYKYNEICYPKDSFEASKLAMAVMVKIKAYGGTVSLEHYGQLRTVAKILLFPLIDSSKPVVVPMETGLGKSTMIEEFLRLKLDDDFNNFGAIVVKERIKDILALEEKLKGKARAVYSFYPDHCLQGYKEYQRIACRNCDADCRMKKAVSEQKNYPVLLMSSERFRLEMLYGRHLRDFLAFCDKDGIEHKRNILIIDEKPPLAINKPVNRKDIRKAYEVIRYIQPGSELYEEAQHLMSHLKKLNTVLNDLDFTSPFLSALEPCFKLSDKFKSFFEEAYTENDVEILECIASLIRKGGILRAEETKIGLEAQAITTDYIEFAKLDGLKTIIFDATAKYDAEYKEGQFAILDLPQIRNYDNLTIYNCPVNLSRTNIFSKKSSARFDFKKLFQDLEGIKDKEVFILTYQKLVNTIKKELMDTMFYKNNRVYIDHFNNIKGKNIYANCTVMLNIGINHKGDEYYLAKAVSVSNKQDFDDLSSADDKAVVLAEKVKRVIESDLFTEMIQNFCRTALRKSTNEQVQIYSFIGEPVLLELLTTYFPNAKIETWYPEEFYKHYLTHGSKRNKKVLQLGEFLKTQFSQKSIITKKEVREALGYTDQDTLANHLKIGYVKNLMKKMNIEEKYHHLQKRQV